MHIIIEGCDLDGDVFREFARVVEEAGGKRTRPDIGVVIDEILRAGPTTAIVELPAPQAIRLAKTR